MSADAHKETPRFTNRLARESSPYLLQHAHNPVDWYPWGPEALEAARAQDKPLFLSVGYSACHWCHVMERESFENETIARLLNENFVSIKVDREERPDIDEIYMTAVQMMTGHGGWPMSVFLLPDGRPYYGGTYFPPESRHGRIGFGSLVSQLTDAYRTRREEVEQVAATIADDLRQATRQRPLSAPEGPLDPRALLRAAVRELSERFDTANGGFGGAPKFPPHHALRLLLRAARDGDDEAQHMALATLEKMALGGIYDHVGGGFHRYATDAVWLLPHFEKMLYDNALLARLYAEAYALTETVAYARVARETCDWVLRDMVDPVSGFHAALDADSEGEEGKYYVWTVEEINEALGDAAHALCERYHIAPGGNYREEATGHPTGANIPYLAIGAADASLPAELAPDVVHSREALLARRYERVPPGKDDKVIASWNGLMIGALAFAGKTLSEPRYLDAARRAATFCLTTLRPDGTLLRRYARGEAGLTAFLDDHAYLADGLLDLFDATGEAHWMDEARSLADTLLQEFWDPEDGGFFFAGAGHETLIARSKDLFDGALPSANGVAARVLVRLGRMPDGERYAAAARDLLTAYRGVLHRAPSGTHTLILAAMDALPAVPGDHDQPVVRLTAAEAVMRLRPGEQGVATFLLQIADGYHVNPRQADRQEMIPTTARLATDAPAAAGPVVFPEPTEWVSGNETLSVYQGTVAFAVPLAATADAPPGRSGLTLTVRCQPCSESECQPPAEFEAIVTIEIV